MVNDNLRISSMTVGTKIIIDHTEVDESIKGPGVGSQLVEASVEYARKEGVKILPL
ncbi:MAG: GNAT family N-acetyltransferase, partial [Bacteroidota bacterium]